MPAYVRDWLCDGDDRARDPDEEEAENEDIEEKLLDISDLLSVQNV